MMTDLGTYHLLVTLNDDKQFIYTVHTGSRWTNGAGDVSPADANHITPGWANEEDMLSAMIYMFDTGDYSCDCNLTIFLCNSMHEEDPDVPCGDTMGPKRLEVMKPNGAIEFEPLWTRED